MKSEKMSQDPNKFNILMLMIDSLSRASVQRYMNETYAMLEKDPNSFIMKVCETLGTRCEAVF